jgi:hypothetical protein
MPMVLAACAGSEPTGAESNQSGRCLYTIEIDTDRALKWAPCSNPPPFAIDKISD